MYEAEDMPAILREHPHFAYPASVKGALTSLRPATRDDAAFILSLRLDPTKGRHLSATQPELAAQRQWLEDIKTDQFGVSDQLVFIVESDHPVGTVRLYDQQGTSFGWGSWILADDAPRGAAVETTRMVYLIGLGLGFTGAHFNVRKDNAKVWQYHEKMGAERVGEDTLNFYYRFDKDGILAALDRYKGRGEIEIVWH